MSSRYDELERLQGLRESGALTDEEFQAEKRRLLAHETIAPPQETDEAPGVPDEPPSRRPLWLLIAGAALVVAIVAGLWLGNLVGGGESYEGGNVAMPQENSAAATNAVEAEAAPDVRSLAPEEQLARAFEAAFGSRGEAALSVTSDGADEDVRYAPGKLIWPAFGPVLLSEGQVQDPAHVSAGKIAIHYLKPAADRFEVVRAWPAGVSTGSFGKVAHWAVSPRFSTWPVIVAEGGGTWQGYSCSWLTLTELRPNGPVELATVPLAYDDAGARTEPGESKSIQGKILNVVRNQSFDVVYSGSRAFSEHYVRGGDRYVVAGGKSGMETC